jgi:hypothetical protein
MFVSISREQLFTNTMFCSSILVMCSLQLFAELRDGESNGIALNGFCFRHWRRAVEDAFKGGI